MEKRKIDFSEFQQFYPFPTIDQCTEDGILAMGGDLSLERLISAYSQGIFPWFSQGDPILWWHPDPRFILFPNEIKVSKSMRPYFNQNRFSVTYDTCFTEVIKQCKSKERKDQDGTWITEEMENAYKQLHTVGIAHSVEVWRGKELVGGLYGVSMGSIFFGESMFSNVPNASKFGFISLVKKLEKSGFLLIDCQVHSTHLESLGAKHIPRDEFIKILKEGLSKETFVGPLKFE